LENVDERIIAKPRFQPSEFWKRALPCFRKVRNWIARMAVAGFQDAPHFDRICPIQERIVMRVSLVQVQYL